MEPTEVKNATEAEERIHLCNVRKRILKELETVGGKLQAQYSDMKETKLYLQENKADMDHAEKASMRQSIDQMSRLGEHRVLRQAALARLAQTPHLGRIDFRADGAGQAEPVYIGVHSFDDQQTGEHLVHDWRAPISSMFYDFETGEAAFDSPEGRCNGEIGLKRQYRIENGELIFMLETALNIQDSVLQEELSRNSSSKMKNIVATIQRDQNAIIRNDHTSALVLQGAAGSGKTSIALHRIAYLLYKYKETIDSSEILIISPNKVFAHYISSVLPELGEQMIKETTMDTLASYLTGYRIKFQTFGEQVAKLLDGRDEAFVERIRFKSTREIALQLEEYVHHIKTHNLKVTDVVVDTLIRRYTVPESYLKHHFSRSAHLPIAERITDGIAGVVEYLLTEHRKKIDSAERASIRKQVKSMFICTDIKSFYKQFYTWVGVPHLFKKGKGSVYEHADVFPLIYLGMLLDGFRPFSNIKHLVIDEMQDYSPIQYRVLARLFPCKKTILGDVHQSVNPHSASAAATIREMLPGADCMYMHKSYRSTIEISRFAQRIQPNPDLEPIERHGTPPQIHACADDAAEIEQLAALLRDFRASGHQTLGLICKTQKQADTLYGKLSAIDGNLHLLNEQSDHFSTGILIATAHLAKGLEFDRIVVPFTNAKNYCTRVDRHMLYVACTRAMHRLDLTHTGKRSSFLDTPSEP